MDFFRVRARVYDRRNSTDTPSLNIPERHANQASHPWYAAHAPASSLSYFVSIENKVFQISKLKVAGSIPIARPIFPEHFSIQISTWTISPKRASSPLGKPRERSGFDDGIKA